MNTAVKFALALESLLLCVYWALKPSWLPLGGGHAEQVAILFTGAIGMFEALEAIRLIFGKQRRPKQEEGEPSCARLSTATEKGSRSREA